MKVMGVVHVEMFVSMQIYEFLSKSQLFNHYLWKT